MFQRCFSHDAAVDIDFSPFVSDLKIIGFNFYIVCRWAFSHIEYYRDFGMTRPGIEPWSPGPLANTLLM